MCLRPAAILLLGLLLPSAAVAQTNVLYMKSQPGDYIGQGQTVTYTIGSFSVSSPRADVVTVSFSDASHWWHLDFAAPDTDSLDLGTYEGATRYPFESPTGPGLSVFGDGRGCNTLSGRFLVREIVRSAGQVVQFAADLEQHCEGNPAALHAAIRVNSTVPVSPGLGVGDAAVGEGPGAHLKFTISLSLPATGPVTVDYATADGTAVEGADYLAAAGQVTFLAGQTSKEVTVETYPDSLELARVLYLNLENASGAPIADAQAEGTIVDDDGPQTYFILDSTPGDYIGQGHWQKLTPIDGNFTAGLQGNAVHVGFDGDTWWDFYAIGPGGALVTTGAYENARRYPFQDSWPGLSFSGDGRGCNTLSGRFDVHEIVLEGSVVRNFAADFVQYCETTMPPLYGSVRFNSRVPPLQPVTYELVVTKAGLGTGTVTSQPAGISCGADCNEQYPRNTEVVLSAAAGANSVFAGWSGACTGTGTCTVTMTGAQSVTASFVRTFSLTVTKAGEGTGNVTSEPAGISCGAACTASYAEGTTVTLTAASGAGAYFAGWSGQCSGTAPVATVLLDAAKSCVASFAPSAVIQFAAAQFQVSEGGGSIAVEVTRSGNLTSTVEVRAATMDGSAVSPHDFSARAEALSFAPGASSATLRVDVQDDKQLEGWEIVHLRLFEPSYGAVLGSTPDATLQILDDEKKRTQFFTDTTYRVVESAPAQVTLRRAGPLDNVQEVTVVTTPLTALGELDFTPARQVVTFAIGQASASLQIATLADSVVEGTESFAVEIQPVTGPGTQRRAVVSILDAPEPSSVGFSAPWYEVNESRGTFEAFVERTGNVEGPASVWYSTRQVTAVAGRDFEPTMRMLTFPAGVRRQVVTVTLLDDAGYDGPESFAVELQAPSGMVLGAQKDALVSIRDEE